MRIVETHDPEVMRIDDDSVLLRFIGFVVILVGAGVWAVFLRAGNAESAPPASSSFLFVLLACLVMGALGIVMILQSSQTVIDRRLRKVATWRRTLWWKVAHVHDLDDYRCVQVVRGQGRDTSWGVQLGAKPDRRDRTVLCVHGLLRADARIFARRVADFSGLEYRDDGAAMGELPPEPTGGGRTARRGVSARNDHRS